MSQRYLFTTARYRLNLVSARAGVPLNWVLLPGGPGLGSESLQALADLLEKSQVPGYIWLVDFPDDGSNLVTGINNKDYFKIWSAGLIELAELLPNIVFIAHSFAGMFILSVPELEKIKNIRGLMLWNTAPDQRWLINRVGEDIEAVPESIKNYASDDISFKQATLTRGVYALMGEKSLETGLKILKNLPYRYQTFAWSREFFHLQYQARWIPDPSRYPVWILGSHTDRLTPLDWFESRADFQKTNIIDLVGTGHFPWLDIPEKIPDLFKNFYEKIKLNL